MLLEIKGKIRLLLIQTKEVKKLKKQTALKAIMVISIIGVIFSGILSYREIFLGNCNLGFVRCGVNTGPIFGLPACVFGLAMYLTVFTISLIGYRSEK